MVSASANEAAGMSVMIRRITRWMIGLRMGIQVVLDYGTSIG